MAPLEPEVERLLADLVEWVRDVPRGDGRSILVTRTQSGTSMRLSADIRARPVVWQDVETLLHEGYLRRAGGSALHIQAFVTPDGFAHYEERKVALGAPMLAVETDVLAYLNGPEFASRHAGAHSKWEQAAKALWSGDKAADETAIGHHAREAMQNFATECVERYGVTSAPADIERSINRLRAVAEALRPILGEREQVFVEATITLVDAQIAYAKAATGLAQRQEHANTKDADLRWEDGRRVVFSVAYAMFELDRVFEQELRA